MILIPVISYAGAVLIIRDTVSLPYIGGVSYFFATLIVAVLLTLVGFGLITVLYSLIYRLVGPSRYGPFDAPPEWGRPNRRR
jgi:hypothetical protein